MLRIIKIGQCLTELFKK